MGYHKTEIKKGEYGEFSKIREEFEELTDAVEQNAKILQLCEIADLLGAIEAYTLNKFGFTMEDMLFFSNQTKEAFQENKR